MASDLSATNWANEPIPANSTVRIAFPSQYNASDLTNFACNYVLLDYTPASNYLCTLESSTL